MGLGSTVLVTVRLTAAAEVIKKSDAETKTMSP
jgi:hypothetical protein